MSGERLPKKLRQTLPPYTRKPMTLPDGTPVVGWSGPTIPTFSGEPVNHDMSKAAIEDGPDIDEADGEPGDPCLWCHGSGWFTETREGSDGRDVDVDWECGRCDGEGIEP